MLVSPSALLHPGDKRVSHLKKRIRQPGTHTMSNRFAEPPKPPESPDEFHDMEKVVVTKSGSSCISCISPWPYVPGLTFPLICGATRVNYKCQLTFM